MIPPALPTSSDSADKPDLDPTSDPASGPASEPISNRAFGPASDPASGLASGPISEPVSDPVFDPAAEPISEPVSDPAPEPAPDPAPDPAAEPISGPAFDPAPEPISGPAFDPAAEPISEPVSDPAPEPAPDPVSEPISGPAFEPVSEPVSEPGSDPAAEPASADEVTTAWALAARGGDADAVERLVRALHRDVLRYVTYLCADPQAVEDLAQDTFLRALGSLHRFEGRSSARSWLLSIARRAVIDSYRRAAVRPRLSDVPDWQRAVELAQPLGLPGFDDGVALLDLLTALPDERREAFLLTQLFGLPYAEAAEVSDCPVGTIRSRVARARATLVDLLAEADGAVPTAA